MILRLNEANSMHILEASIRVLDEKFVFGQLMTLRFTIFTRMYIRGTELKDRDSIDVVEGMLRDQFYSTKVY